MIRGRAFLSRRNSFTLSQRGTVDSGRNETMTHSLPNDEIHIVELELMAKVGVPEEERAQPQRLVANLILQPPHGFADLSDDLARTVDYAAVAESLRALVAGRCDRLIETMAQEMAEHLLRHFDLRRVELELRKFILPETRYVAVRVIRERPPGR